MRSTPAELMSKQSVKTFLLGCFYCNPVKQSTVFTAQQWNPLCTRVTLGSRVPAEMHHTLRGCCCFWQRELETWQAKVDHRQTCRKRDHLSFSDVLWFTHYQRWLMYHNVNTTWKMNGNIWGKTIFPDLISVINLPFIFFILKPDFATNVTGANKKCTVHLANKWKSRCYCNCSHDLILIYELVWDLVFVLEIIWIPIIESPSFIYYQVLLSLCGLLCIKTRYNGPPWLFLNQIHTMRSTKIVIIF